MRQYKIDCTSDLHGIYPKDAISGDILIVAGDLTATDKEEEYFEFLNWIQPLDYEYKIVVAGNHDNFLQKNPDFFFKYDTGIIYLCDSGISINICQETKWKGLEIWGSPWTKTFHNMNPCCMAYTVGTENELACKFHLIPSDVDILITHGPPYMILDGEHYYQRYGSEALKETVESLTAELHVFGHIHEGFGSVLHKSSLTGSVTQYANVAHMDRVYDPVNPIQTFYFSDGVLKR